MRAERAKLKSRRDDMIIAQGKRSAALGSGRKMIPSFFPSGLARQRCAKPEGREEVGWGGSLPRAAACAFAAPRRHTSAALSWAAVLLPLRQRFIRGRKLDLPPRSEKSGPSNHLNRKSNLKLKSQGILGLIFWAVSFAGNCS